MRLPRHIMILGRKFKIELKDDIIVNGKPASGSCDATNRVIEIEKSQSINEQMGLLSHEIGHAGLEIYGLDQRLSDLENEIFCQLIRALIEDYIKAFK